MRNMFQLNMRTHKYFIEPISNSPHLKMVLLKRFLNFVVKIRNGKKHTVKHIMNVISTDCQSITGNNLRSILLLTQKEKVDQLIPSDAFSLQYHPISVDNEWKLLYIIDIIETLNTKMEIPGFEDSELREILDYLCVS